MMTLIAGPWSSTFTGAAVVLAQKLLPPSASMDVPVALTIVGLGIVILVAPASVPGLVPTM